MLNVANQRNVPPYWAVTAGPKSHSPAPTAEPATKIPGPISSGLCRQPNRGGGGKSPTCQGASGPSRAVTTLVVNDVGMLLSRVPAGGPPLVGLPKGGDDSNRRFLQVMHHTEGVGPEREPSRIRWRPVT